jgi:hypothetical protein
MHAQAQASDPTVAETLRQFVPEYLAKYSKRMPPHHRKVLGLIVRCKTGELGDVVYRCQHCGDRHWVGRSCGNRHCPNCQKERTQTWLAQQTAKLLPVQYFVVTFTVPQQLRDWMRSHPEIGYEAIFQAGSRTIRTLMAEPKNLGSTSIGFWGALHTWGRNLKDYHPHVHFVVPGGGISPNDSKWMQVPPDRLFHPSPAKRLYKKYFVQALRDAGCYAQLPAGILKFDWVVNIKPVGDGRAVLKYLAPYVYRVAICDKRIVCMDESGVTYQVKPSGQKHFLTRHLSGEAFVRSFAQHILPPGFRKLRYYGFLSPNCRVKLAHARWLAWMWRGWTCWLGSALLGLKQATAPRRPPKCSRCGQELELEGVTDSHRQWLFYRLTAPRGPPHQSSPTARSSSKCTA